MGWKNTFTGDVKMFEIQGGHGGHNGIFTEPGVVQIAEKLSEVMEKANK
jgi:hypothetical protein